MGLAVKRDFGRQLSSHGAQERGAGEAPTPTCPTLLRHSHLLAGVLHYFLRLVGWIYTYTVVLAHDH